MPLLDPNDRDSHLVWPHSVVEAELNMMAMGPTTR
jgi:hypothetical protein